MRVEEPKKAGLGNGLSMAGYLADIRGWPSSRRWKIPTNWFQAWKVHAHKNSVNLGNIYLGMAPVEVR